MYSERSSDDEDPENQPGFPEMKPGGSATGDPDGILNRHRGVAGRIVRYET